MSEEDKLQVALFVGLIRWNERTMCEQVWYNSIYQIHALRGGIKELWMVFEDVDADHRREVQKTASWWWQLWGPAVAEIRFPKEIKTD